MRWKPPFREACSRASGAPQPRRRLTSYPVFDSAVNPLPSLRVPPPDSYISIVGDSMSDPLRSMERRSS